MKYLKIKKNTDFAKLFKKGKRVYSPALTLVYAPSDSVKMGIALTKNHKKAVVRNRIKRLLREAFSKNAGLLKYPCSVIILPKVADEYDFKTFEKSLIICINKVNLCESRSKK